VIRVLVIAIVVLPYFGTAQSWKFKKEAAQVMGDKDSSFAIESLEPSKGAYDFLLDSATALQPLFLSALYDESKNRPDTLQQSENLNRMASLATKYWRGSSYYASRKKWARLNKYFRRASYLTQFSFGISKQVSFRVPLVDLVGRDFYYDPKGSAGGLNLYKGKRPKTKEERENQVPMENHSTEQIVELFLSTMNRKMRRELDRGVYSHVGLSVELDKNSLYKTKIPTVRVVLVFGAKRFRTVSNKYKEDNQED